MESKNSLCDVFPRKIIDINKDVAEGEYICPVVQQSIKNIIETENYLDYDVTTKSVLGNGLNFMADLIEINIKGKTKDGEKENHIFVKHVVREQGAIRELVNIEQAYLREVFIYEQLFKIYDKLYDEANVPNIDRLRKIKGYDSNKHIIVMENLSYKGFKVLDRMETAPLNYAEDVMKQIAKFHALSFVLEHKNPTYFEKEIKSLKTPFTVQNRDILDDAWKKVMTSMTEQSFRYINSEQKHKKEKCIQKVVEKVPKYLNGKIGYIKCLSHGDLIPNNTLIRENVGEGIETIMIDYQLMSYRPPVMDILYFMYISTDRNFRKNHLEHLKDLYHNTFTKHLQLFHLDANNFFSKDQFEVDFNECLDYGLISALYILPGILSDDPDILKNESEINDFIVNKVFTERINGILQDYIEWGLV